MYAIAPRVVDKSGHPIENRGLVDAGNLGGHGGNNSGQGGKNSGCGGSCGGHDG